MTAQVINIIQVAIFGSLVFAIVLGVFIYYLLNLSSIRIDLIGMLSVSLLIAPIIAVFVGREAASVEFQYDRPAAAILEAVYMARAVVVPMVLAFVGVMLIENDVPRGLIVTGSLVIATMIVRVGLVVGRQAFGERGLYGLHVLLGAICKYWVAVTPCFGGIASAMAGGSDSRERGYGSSIRQTISWRAAGWGMVVVIIVFVGAAIYPSLWPPEGLECRPDDRGKKISITGIPFQQTFCQEQSLEIQTSTPTRARFVLTMQMPFEARMVLSENPSPAGAIEVPSRLGRWSDSTPYASFVGELKPNSQYSLTVDLTQPPGDRALLVMRGNLNYSFLRLGVSPNVVLFTVAASIVAQPH
jgi:hypothetical protein